MKTIIIARQKNLLVLRLMPEMKNNVSGLVYGEDRYEEVSDSWNKDKIASPTIKTMCEIYKNRNIPNLRETISNFKGSSIKGWALFAEILYDPNFEFLTVDEFRESYPNDTILLEYRNRHGSSFMPLVGPAINKDTESTKPKEFDYNELFGSNKVSSDNEKENEEEDDDYEEEYEEDSYIQYDGTYASDVEHLNDDYIDDALGGDPEAYWNVD